VSDWAVWQIALAVGGGALALLLILGVWSYRATQTWADRALAVIPFSPISMPQIRIELERKGFRPRGVPLYVSVAELVEEGWVSQSVFEGRYYWQRVRSGSRTKTAWGWKMPPIATEVPA
jgi:hypothetical protein